jgi:exo-1,4-beta-D-glucosaminidase
MPRSRKFSARMLEGAFVSMVLPVVVAGAPEAQPARIYLHKNWQIQSSCEVKAAGEQISLAGFEAKGWHKADVPATVVGALVTGKTYPDPNYGTNMKSFPGLNYSDKNLFANQEMPEGSPFRCSWWYRTEFTLPAGEAKKTEWLNFLGINYRANIWINGQKVADANDVAGTYRSY